MQPLTLNSFSKINETLDPELIQQNELVGSINCVLDKLNEVGKPNKRGGWTRFNTNVIDATLPIKSLHDVKDEADSNYLLGVSGTKLRKSLNGTGAWSDVKTGLTTGLRTRITTYGSRHILTNGTDKPFIVEGVDFATINNLELETPNTQDFSGNGTTGGSLDTDSTYVYTVIYRTENGERSDYGCPYRIAISGSDNEIDLSNIPIPSDSRIASKELYRTEGNGKIFYLLTILDIAATSYNDVIADTGLILSQPLFEVNIPVKAKYICEHKDRIILGYISILTTSIIQKPFSNITLTDLGGGSLAAGTYKYKSSFVYRDGTESILSPYASITVATGTSKISVSVYGALIGASSTWNTDIIALRVYRTTNGGSTYYWIGDAFNDNIAADELSDASLVGNAQYPKSGQDTNIDYPNGIAISNIGTPSEFPADNIFLIGNDDTDIITGIFDDDNGIMIFKERSIYKQYSNTSSVLNWQLDKLQEKFGADIATKNGNEYLVLFKKRVWRVQGSSRQEIPGFEYSFDQADTIYDLIYYPKLKWYLFSISSSGVYCIYRYSEVTGSWAYFTITKADCFEIKNISTGDLLIGDGVYPIKYNISSEVDNEAGSDVQILTYLRTKTFSFPDGVTLGRLRFLHLIVNKKSGQDITITITDPSISPVSNKSYVIDTGSGEINLTGKDKLITDGMTGTLKKFRKLYIEIAGYGLTKFINLRLEYRVINEASNVAA